MSEAEINAQAPVPSGSLPDHDAELRESLRRYRRQLLLTHLIGPAISLLVHAGVLTAIALFAGTSGGREEVREIEVQVKEMPVKQLDEPIIQKMQEVIKEVQTDAPVVDAPSVPNETASAADNTGTGGGDQVADAPVSAVDSGAVGMASDEIAEGLDVRPVVSPLKLSGLYIARGDGARQSAVAKGGGSGRGQDAVLKALRWLKAKQAPDGSWEGQPPHTALALLCFLAHGETPISTEFGATVQGAIMFLAKNGVAASPRPQDQNWPYSNGIVTYALAEAYGMTKHPLLKPPMEKGLQYILDGQGPHGGFHYFYMTKVDPKLGRAPWDMSVTGWQVQAMKAGLVAGADNPNLEKAIEKTIRFIKTDAYATAPQPGFGYQNNGAAQHNMTGVGVVCLQLMGDAQSGPGKAALETVAKQRLDAYQKYANDPAGFNRDGGPNIYGWYYDTQAMFNAGGRYWRAWQKTFEDVLVRAQGSDGSWVAQKAAGNNTVLTTAWCCLQLEVYYRYLPSFDIKLMTRGRPQAESVAPKDVGLIIE